MDPNAKRTAIMSAGEGLFAKNGYTGTTMADVAAEAGVAVGTVYRLFPDKPSLLAALHKNMEDQFIGAIRASWQMTDTYADKFNPLIDALFDQAATVRDAMPLYTLTRDMVGAADYVPGAGMIASIDELYLGGVETGAFRAFPPGIQAPIAHAMVEGGLRAWMSDPTEQRRLEVTRELKALFKRAFLAN